MDLTTYHTITELTEERNQLRRDVSTLRENLNRQSLLLRDETRGRVRISNEHSLLLDQYTALVEELEGNNHDEAEAMLDLAAATHDQAAAIMQFEAGCEHAGAGLGSLSYAKAYQAAATIVGAAIAAGSL